LSIFAPDPAFVLSSPFEAIALSSLLERDAAPTAGPSAQRVLRGGGVPKNTNPSPKRPRRVGWEDLRPIRKRVNGWIGARIGVVPHRLQNRCSPSKRDG
jgi:hypothetical protein